MIVGGNYGGQKILRYEMAAYMFFFLFGFIEMCTYAYAREQDVPGCIMVVTTTLYKITASYQT